MPELHFIGRMIFTLALLLTIVSFSSRQPNSNPKKLFSLSPTLSLMTDIQTGMKSSFTQEDILNYLEETGQENYHFFIDFEHPYFFPAGSRLTLYADDKRWAIVFEKSGYSTGNNCGEIEFAYFCNCLINLKSGIPGDILTSNMKTVILIEDTDLEGVDESKYEELVSKDKTKIKVRDSFLAIEQDSSKYIAKGIMPRDYDNPKGLFDFYSLIRYLEEEHPDVFRATDKELRMCIPEDLPQLMHIDNWHHETYSKYRLRYSETDYRDEVDGKKPGDYETYKMIADILVSRDTTKWKPTLRPNNNWRNWPGAGHM
jgi:hypothetical protein